MNTAMAPILIDNVVAGSERSGFWVDGERCDTTSKWRGNVAHSTLIGVMMLPKDGIRPCSRLNHFTVYRSWDFGIYTQVGASIHIDNLLALDNGLSVFNIVIGPGSVSHMYENKFVEIRDSIIVGRSSSIGCDAKPFEDNNYILSDNGRSWRSPDGGFVGISFASFLSGSNNAPLKPFTASMSYNAIRGQMRIEGK